MIRASRVESRSRYTGRGDTPTTTAMLFTASVRKCSMNASDPMGTTSLGSESASSSWSAFSGSRTAPEAISAFTISVAALTSVSPLSGTTIRSFDSRSMSFMGGQADRRLGGWSQALVQECHHIGRALHDADAGILEGGDLLRG